MRILVCLALVACQGGDPAPAPAPAPVTAPPPQPQHAGKVELVDAPATGGVAAIVVDELARAATDKARLVVYVGATWCEPCRHFHDAAASGALDAQFGATRFLVFDLDRDGSALEAAGYKSALVPLFAIPGPDGTASGLHIEGSIKGDGAVGQIAPRLRKLLDAHP